MTQDLLFVSDFVDGAGSFDMMRFFGYFNGSLVNQSATSVPIVKKNTKFEMNGSFYKLESDTTLPDLSLDRTSLVYVYAAPIPAGFELEYSTDAPVFVPAKNGYYSGARRALYKLFFIKDVVDQYVAKTFINDDFTQFAYYAINDLSVVQFEGSEVYTLSGTGNPEPQTVTLSPGAYAAVLKGAGGGRSMNFHATGGYYYTFPGGAGGLISEVFTLNQTTTFTAYTGQGGGSGYSSVSSSISGGGGSGTFLYSPNGYFACAGGGGGAAGYDTYGIGSGGGAGGSVGNGGDGGKLPIDLHIISGGGYPYTLYSTGSGYNGLGVYGLYTGSPAAFAAYTFILDLWKNTNGANGQGADTAPNNSGGDGGNNRNVLRGGGAPGGDGNSDVVLRGGDGAITIYSLN
jgi:hypothetical protein